MIGRVALLVTFKKLNQNHKAYHEVIYVTSAQFERDQYFQGEWISFGSAVR